MKQSTSEIDTWLTSMGFVEKPEPKEEIKVREPRAEVDGYGWYRRGEECPF